MACRCAPALVTLRNQIDAAYPGRDKASDGCCGDPAHAGRKSDHNSTAGFAHALDIDEDIVANMGDRPLWETGILLLSDHRTKYLIYEARILYPDGTDKPYTGPNAHRHHLHISIKTIATRDTRPWKIAKPASPAPPLPPPIRRRGMTLVRDASTGVVWLVAGDNVTHVPNPDYQRELEKLTGPPVDIHPDVVLFIRSAVGTP